MSLKGSRELRRRLKAIRTVFKPAGRQWADETARIAKTMVPVRTGKTQRSIRRRNASQRKATVVGFYPVNFIDAGAKAHDEKPRKTRAMKLDVGGRTVFAKKVHKRAQQGNHFKKRAAERGLEKVDIVNDLLQLWNEAA